MNKTVTAPATADPIGFDELHTAFLDSHLLVDVEEASRALYEAIVMLDDMTNPNSPHYSFMHYERANIAESCRRLNDLVRRMPQGGDA